MRFTEKTQIDLPLASWCFGNTNYQSGGAEAEWYILLVTDQTITLQRKSECVFPGLFVVLSQTDLRNIQVADVDNGIAPAIRADRGKTFLAMPTWSKLEGSDSKALGRFIGLFDTAQPEFQHDWVAAMSMIKNWSVETEGFFKLLLNDPEEKVLDYPWPMYVTAYRKHIAWLNKSGWLNDTIVAVGLRQLYDKITEQDPAQAEHIHILSSFFFDKLYRPGIRADNGKVKKWSRHSKPLDRDYIVVPVNSNNSNWYLAVICHPRRVLDRPDFEDPPLPASWGCSPQDPNPSTDLPKCTIAIMDSLGSKHHQCVRALREYLQDKTEALTGRKVNTRREGGVVAAIHLPVPKQHNRDDCGLFLIYFAEVFLAHTEELLGSPKALKKDVWRQHPFKGCRNEFKGYVEEESPNWQAARARNNMSSALNALAAH